MVIIEKSKVSISTIKSIITIDNNWKLNCYYDLTAIQMLPCKLSLILDNTKVAGYIISMPIDFYSYKSIKNRTLDVDRDLNNLIILDQSEFKFICSYGLAAEYKQPEYEKMILDTIQREYNFQQNICCLAKTNYCRNLIGKIFNLEYTTENNVSVYFKDYIDINKYQPKMFF